MTTDESSSRLRRLAKEGAWVAIGQIVVVVGGLVLVRVLTEYLEPDQYGQLALGLTAAALVNEVVLGGIANGIGRYYSIAAEKRDLHGYLRASFSLIACASVLLASLGLIIFMCLYWLGYTQWIGLTAAALGFSLLRGYNSALSGIQNAARQRTIVAFHSGLDAWLKILFAVAVLLWVGTSSTAVIIGYLCSSLVITGSQLIFLRKTIPSRAYQLNACDWMPKIWAYSLPFTAFGTFTWLQQVSDRWSLSAFASTNDVGLYTVLYQLGFTPIALITGMATSFLGPILYQRSGDATDDNRNTYVHQLSWKITLISLVITLFSFAITHVFHERIFGYLVALEYRSISYLLPWVVLAGGAFAAGQMLALKLMSEMKPSAMTTAKIVTALVGCVLNVVGAALAGMQGVVSALVAFSVIYFVWMAVLGRYAPSKNT